MSETPILDHYGGKVVFIDKVTYTVYRESFHAVVREEWQGAIIVDEVYNGDGETELRYGRRDMYLAKGAIRTIVPTDIHVHEVSL